MEIFTSSEQVQLHRFVETGQDSLGIKGQGRLALPEQIRLLFLADVVLSLLYLVFVEMLVICCLINPLQRRIKNSNTQCLNVKQ